jgi:hypothetical protein
MTVASLRSSRVEVWVSSNELFAIANTLSLSNPMMVESGQQTNYQFLPLQILPLHHHRFHWTNHFRITAFELIERRLPLDPFCFLTGTYSIASILSNLILQLNDKSKRLRFLLSPDTQSATFGDYSAIFEKSLRFGQWLRRADLTQPNYSHSIGQCIG